jgi:hypothetical protein
LDERETFVRGTLLGAAAVGGVAVVGLALWGRWAWATGFAVGALISLGNFQLIARAVGGVVGLEGGRATNTLWKGALFRFGIAGAVLVVALLVFHVSLPALVAGLLITQVTMIALWLARAMRSLT